METTTNHRLDDQTMPVTDVLLNDLCTGDDISPASYQLGQERLVFMILWVIQGVAREAES